MPYGITVSCEPYTMGFPVCYGSPSDVFAASSGFVHLYMLRFKEKERRAAVVAKATLHKQGSANLNFQSVCGLCKNFARMSPIEFEFLIYLIGEKISKKDTVFRKAISVQERLALMHSLTGVLISFPSSSRASFFLILLKCIGCSGSQVISFLLYFPHSTPFHNYQNAQETTEHYRFTPLFKTQASGMERRREEQTVVTRHVAHLDLLRP